MKKLSINILIYLLLWIGVCSGYINNIPNASEDNILNSTIINILPIDSDNNLDNIVFNSDDINKKENSVIVEFFETPEINYASPLLNELKLECIKVKKLEELSKLKKNISIESQLYANKLYLDDKITETTKIIDVHKTNILKNHSNALKQIELDNIHIKIIREYHNIFNGFSAQISNKDMEILKSNPYVKAIYQDQTVNIFLQDSVPLINATKVWLVQNSTGDNITGKNVKVAIIDTGIDYTHTDLGGGIGQGFKVVDGWDFYNNDADPMDDNGHGTHVAGIVAANGKIKGVAPDVKLMGYKVSDSRGSGSLSDVIAGIEKAVDPDDNPLTDDGANIISISLGGKGSPEDPLSQAVNNANDAGILIIVAAGNMGSKNSIGTPGFAEKALTVGATDKSNAIAYFSSIGPVTWSNGSFIKPELVAPGVNINSTVPDCSTSSICSQSKYNILNGTSMATPHVTGVAALLIQLHPDWNPEQLKSALITTAIDLNYDIYTGGAGRIDALMAMNVEELVNPSILNLGLVDPYINIWQINNSIKLENIANKTKNYNISVKMNYSQGISYDLYPTNIKLNPNYNTTFNFSINVNNSLAEFNDYGGTIIIQSDLNKIRIPFGFVKSSARFNDFYRDNGVDLDYNGLYENLTIEVGFNISKAGTFKVRGYLYNSSRYITPYSNNTYLNVGNQIVQLNFDGTTIWKSYTNGSFYLNSINIYDSSGNILDASYHSYTTRPYNYTDFAPPSPLSVNLTKSPNSVITGGTSQISAYVTSNGSAVANASVHLNSSGGTLNLTDGLTDDAGYFNTTYRAPMVNSTHLICANVSKLYHSNNSGCDSILVINDTAPSSTSIQSMNNTFGVLLRGQARTINYSIILNNTGDSNTTVEAKFSNNTGVIGLINGNNILGAANFSLGLPGVLVPLDDTGADVQVAITQPGVTRLDASLYVPIDAVAGDYNGTIILTFSDSI